MISINDGDYIDTLINNNCTYCESPEDEEYSVKQDQGIDEMISFCSRVLGVVVNKRMFTRAPYLECYDDIFHPSEINISKIKIIKLKIHYYEETKRNISWVQSNLTADEFIEFCLDRGMRILGIK